MTALTTRALPRTIQMNRTFAVTADVLAWARAHQLPAGFSRVPAQTYEAYLKAHPHLSDGDGLVQPPRGPVRMVMPQPSQIAQMLRSAEQRAARPEETGVGKAIAAWQTSVRAEVGMKSAPVVVPVVEEVKPARKRRSSTDKSHGRKYPVGVREWARENGFRVGNGAIAPEVIEAFYVAHPEVERTASAA